MEACSSFVMVSPLCRLLDPLASHFAVTRSAPGRVRQSLLMAKHRWLRRTIGAGVVAGIAYAVWRAVETNRLPGSPEWEPQPFPFPPQPRKATATDTTSARPTAATAWTAPTDGGCPPSHPVKAKLASGIYHVPGGQSYDRTTPDRCYVDAAAAERDGLRAAKR